MNEEFEFVLTADKSYTLKSFRFNEHYHSIYGAITESQWIYINEGLDYVSKKTNNIRILEIGFGTGLNLLLSLHYHKKHKNNIIIDYNTIEPFPLSIDIVKRMKFCENEEMTELNDIFLFAHKCPEACKIKLYDNFWFVKYHKKLEDFEVNETYNLIYYDPFSPNVQPEMWNEDTFYKLTQFVENQTVLVTYSCKGEVKRNLRKCGFKVEKIPGPPGKREIIRAVYLKKIEI